MTRKYSTMVPGARETGAVLEVTAPFDNQVLGAVEAADAATLERALETAWALFRDRAAWLPVARRIEILDAAGLLMRAQRETLALEAAREGGKPLTDSLVEVDRAIDGIRECTEYLRTQAGRGVPMGVNAASAGRLAFTQYEPMGVVLAFSAFNHPVNLIVHQVCPAIAAGCPFIIKPAEATPLSCWRVLSILRQAGLPPEWGQALVVNDMQLAGALARDRRVGFFSFIGSGKVGWMLRSKLAPGTRCTLEHGGAAPVIVAADADLEDALAPLTKGGMYHAGQVCVSVQRVFADRSIARELAMGLAEASKQLVVGDPTLAQTEVGPLIREAEVQRVDEWVTEAVEGGAEVLTGGAPLSATTFAPTILFDPPAESRVCREEVFGPVVTVTATDTLDEAVARANELPVPFQAAVFTRDIDTALSVSRRLDAATVMINDHTAFRVDWMPFGGLRESGLGTGGIPQALADMQVEKLLVVRSKGL